MDCIWRGAFKEVIKVKELPGGLLSTGHRKSDMTERLHRENSPQKTENLQTCDSVTMFTNDGAKCSNSSTLKILI